MRNPISWGTIFPVLDRGSLSGFLHDFQMSILNDFDGNDDFMIPMIIPQKKYDLKDFK